ncbi:MAG: aspartate aminotransferase family protein [Verrucomicrobia bacterium]|nr:aspartate aminotransferase family protein [Verrucomicrobiota bacterium]MCG2679204.1 aspartate aminotransferase family protein [Kiritimatiellia bacterium]MBU4248597.1 aspartate aminotransferase family protein [Verrucomicrobiota bacterium]MBU4290059.1 aspartate aminotransferase family protein [Verrucomicrobiota bacterium]MBU4428921.1 aspartate aminotransferase family protein [Verrucomicrobiota bacterium]
MTKSEDTIQLFDQHVIPSYSRKPVVFVRGKGTKIWDADGKVYLDFLAGIAVTGAGHSHPKIIEAIRRQSEQLIHISNLYYHENQALLAKALSELALNGKCFFCNSGAEANEALIKLARLWGHDRNRFEIITMRDSFHGRTLATLTATGQTKIQKGFEPLPAGFVYADFNNLESVKAAITEKTAAILVEAVQGEGGVIPAQPEFLKGLRTLCTEKDILLLCDEVQCGMGRTGHWFAFQAYDIEPDAFSLAKALAGGYPMGAIVAGPKLADVFQPGKHGSTFGGSPLACAVALAMIQIIREEGLLQHATQMGERFKKGLQALVEKYKPYLVEVRGRGLMLGLVLNQPAKTLEARLMDTGLLSLATAENVIRFLPPLNVKQNEVDEAIDIIADTCAEWHAELTGIPLSAEPETEAEAAPAATELPTAPEAQAEPAAQP